MKKRVISLLLCLCMLFPMQMLPAWAVEEQTDSASEQVEETKQEQKEDASSEEPEEKEEESPSADEETEEEASPAVEEEKEEASPAVEEEEKEDSPVEETEEPEEVPTPVLTQTTLPETKYLSDIEPDSAKVGWDVFQKDRNPDKGAISVFVEGEEGARTFEKGIGAHAEATIIYDLGENHGYNYLSGYFSVNSTKAGSANARILVYTTNNMSSWGYPVFTSETLTGANAVPLTKIDITGYRYLKIYCDPLGHNGYDHTVVADAQLYAVENYVAPTYEDFVFQKNDETADQKAIKEALDNGATYASLLSDETTKKALMNRMFMMKLGSGSDDYIKNQKAFLTGTETEVAQKKALLQWLKDNPDYMAELLAGGDPEGCTFLESMNILSKLYAKYKGDLSDTSALHISNPDKAGRTRKDVYRTMMFAIALSGDVYAWLDTGSLQDPVERYGKFRVLYNHGTYQMRNDIFENLCVEEMRYVMNVRIWNDEITWLNAYVRENPKGESGFPALYSPHRYLRYGKDWDNAAKGYLNESNYPTHAATYFLNTYGDDFVVPFSTKSKLWMVFAGSHICWGISYTGTNFAAAFGVPSKYVSQPGHGAWLIMNRGTDANSSTWGIDNNIYGWTSTSLVGWNLGNEHVRTMCGWGIPKNGWVSNNESSYILLSQYALNHEDKYTQAELLMSMDSYTQTAAEKETLYREILKIMPYHLDAWYGLIKLYTNTDNGYTKTQIADLAVEMGKEMQSFPLPMHDLMALLRAAVNDDATALARVNNAEEKALLDGSKGIVLDDQQQSDVVKTMANYLRGNSAPTKIATFSFETGNLVVEDTFKGIRYRYSLDGGTSWSDAVETANNTSHSLTAEEIHKISEEKDILIWLDGWATADSNPDKDQAYCIDITAGSAVSGLTQNDNENRFFGDVSRIEYSIDEKANWQDLTDETRFEGEKKVYLRKKATGCTMQGTVSGPYDFTENSTKTRSYIPLSRMTYVGCSTEETSRQDNAARLAMDGLPSTIWHTLWDGSDKEKYIIFKTDKPTFFSGVNYTPRQDGGTNGNFHACTVYASMDGENWYLAGSGSWNNGGDKSTKCVTFDPCYGQYIKVVATNTVGNYASASSIELFEDTTLAGKSIAGVHMVSSPTKKTYDAGEKPVLDGIRVECFYTDGTKSIVPDSMLQVTPSVLNTVGTQTIHVTYLNYPAMTFDVTVNANTRTATNVAVLSNPTKSSYFQGQTLNLSGLVVEASDANGKWYPTDYTTSLDAHLDGNKKLKDSGTFSLTVTYQGQTASLDNFEVTVAGEPKSIEITGMPDKLEYELGEPFDGARKDGTEAEGAAANGVMEVTLTFKDDTTAVLKWGSGDFVVDTENFSALPGEKSLEVYLADYPDIITTLPVTVNPTIVEGDFRFDVVEVKSGEPVYQCYLSGYTNQKETVVSVPATVTKNGITYDVIGVQGGAFGLATQVVSLSLPGSIQILETDSLSNLGNLENLYLTGILDIANLTIQDDALPELNEEEGKTKGVYMASAVLTEALTAKYKDLNEIPVKSILDDSVIDHLEITPPDKVEYALHEAVAETGLTVSMVLKNGIVLPLARTQYTVTGFDSGIYGLNKTVTVATKEGGLSGIFTMSVPLTPPVIQTNPTDAVYIGGTAVQPLTVSLHEKEGATYGYQWYYSADSVISTEDDKKLTTEKNCIPTESGYYYAVAWEEDTAGGTSETVRSAVARVLIEGNAVTIGETGYATLADAFNAAQEGDTIVVHVDLTQNETITLSDKKNLTLKGINDVCVTRGNSLKAAMFSLTGSASLTVEDLMIDGDDVVASSGIFTMTGSTVLTLSEGTVIQDAVIDGNGAAVNATSTDTMTLTVNGATIQNCSSTSSSGYGAIYLGNRGNITVNSGTFRNNKAVYGGVIGTVSGKAGETKILSGTFENNNATHGGVVFLGGPSTLTISGGTFTNNTGTNGGVIDMYNGGTLNINGGTFGNNTGTNGGVVYQRTGSSAVNFTNGIMKNCTATSGGAIYSSNASITISGDAKIENCSVDAGTAFNWDGKKGGAIYADSGSVTMNGGCILTCQSSGQGGAIYSNEATVTLTNGTIQGCQSGYGGGIYSETGKVTVTGGVIDNCSAICGGGLDVVKATVEVTGGKITACSSSENGKGAAIHTAESGSTVTISGGTFSAREDSVGRIVIYGSDANTTATITGGTFYGNLSLKAGSISGGRFELDPTAFLTSGCVCYKDTGDALYHVETASLSGTFSLSLAENIDMNFYLRLTEGTSITDYTVTATFAGKEPQTLTGTATEDGRYRYVAAEVYSYQMTQPVTVTVSYNNNVKKYSCSVKDYCTETIAENSENAKLVNLCNAILQYGGDAQAYFKEKTYGGTSYDVGEVYTVSNRVTPEKPEVTNYVSGTLAGFSDFSTTLILGSETSMKLYFTYTGTSNDLSSYSFTCDNGKAVTGPERDSGDTYFVKITGITPCDLSKNFTLSITKDNESVQVHGSPYAFAATNWTSENDLLRQLCQSLVQYGTMAKEYISE